jgi:transposase-like protein
MQRAPNGKYTKEFRQEAVKLVTQEKLSVAEVSRRLELPPNTIHNWLKKFKEGKLGEVGQSYRPLTEVELENARLKKALAIAKMECEILKKAAAYFARESLHGTRQ